MSDRPLTVGNVLFPVGWEAPPRDDHPKLQEIQKAVQKELRSVDMFALNGALLNKVASMLDAPFVHALAGGWSKCGEILKYRDREKYRPEDTFLVALAEHTVSSEYRPSIDMLINNVPLKTLAFVVTLGIDVKGFQLEIQDAKIRRVRTGTWLGSGQVTLDGMQIYRKELQPVALPGVVHLGEGLAIGG